MKKLLCLLPIIALIIGCGGEAVYFPLAVGNQWEYSIEQTITLISPDTTWEYTGNSITEITAETTLDNGNPVLEQVTTTTWDDTLMTDATDTTYVEETEDYMLIYNSKADTDPDTSLMLPIEAGNTWTVYSNTADTMTAYVVGKATVTVPAGSYDDCWQIEYSFSGGVNVDWFAPDFGVVRHEYEMSDSNTTIQFIKELESVTIN
jgi:hypothetical protein